MKTVTSILLSTLFFFAFAAESVHAQRHALVIGNGKYQFANPLTNAPNDATDVAKALSEGDWKVTLLIDAGIREMIRGLREFCEEAQGAEYALVFYAGHGIEVKDQNYLLPVDAELREEDGEDALPLETIALKKVMNDLANAQIRLKTVVLDACRNNPLQRSWLSSRGSGGLATVDEKQLPEGAMLIFSTSPGKTASDGIGRNSPFTSAFLSRVTSAGGSVAVVFADVANSMKTEQRPWIRFDGSGDSFAAFQNYPLIPGMLPPTSIMPMTDGLEGDDQIAAQELLEAIRSGAKAEMPASLEKTVSLLGDRPRDEIPEVVLARMELVCLRMILAGSWESDLDLEIVRKISAPPFESSMGPMILANEQLEMADLLIAEGQVQEASERLKKGFDWLDQGIDRENSICKLKKGSLLTRHYYLKYKAVDGLELPGTSETGLPLIREAYTDFRGGHLEKRFFEPAGVSLDFDDDFCEAQSAIVLAQCWHFGIGTGKPKAFDPNHGFEGKQSGSKAIDYYSKVVDLQPENGEARAGLLEMLIQKNKTYNYWTDEMIEIGRVGSRLNNNFCLYHYACHLWADDPSGNKEEVFELMKRAAAPGETMTEEARAWLEKNRD